MPPARTQSPPAIARWLRARHGRLVVALALLACAPACGRLGFNQAPAPDDAAAGSDAAADASAQHAGTAVGGISALPAGALDLGVTATPAGFTVTFTPIAGGDMNGINLDTALQPQADWRVTSTNNKYVATTMTWTGSPMTTMTTDGNLTYIKRYAADLSTYTQTDMQDGLAAKPAYAMANARWFYAIVDRTTLHVREMQSDGTPVGGVIDVSPGDPAGTPLGGALAGDGDSLYVVWSHAQRTCAWATLNVRSNVLSLGSVAGPCLAPRLASQSGRAAAVFDDGAMVRSIALPAPGGGSAAVLAAGTGARIAAAPAGGFRIAWQAGSGLRTAAYQPGGALTDIADAELPAGLQAYELAATASHTYLFAIAHQQLWWAQLD